MKKKKIMQKEITTIVRLIGSKNELTRLRKLVDCNGLGFDFDKVLSQPKELRDMPVDVEISEKEELNRLITYGACDILEWRKTFWGTEWTNIGTSWFSNNYFKMKTVTAPAIGILKQLSILFSIKLQAIYSSDGDCQLFTIEKGECTAEKAKKDEAELVKYLVENEDFNYKMWEGLNKKARKSKKLDMELLFNYDTPFLIKAKKLIKYSTKKVII